MIRAQKATADIYGLFKKEDGSIDRYEYIKMVIEQVLKEEGDLMWEAALDEAIGDARSSYILDYGVKVFTEEQKIYTSGYNKACEDICKKLEDLRIGSKENKDEKMIRFILAMILLSTPAMAKDVIEIKIMEDLSDSESVKSKVNVWKLDENGEKIERIYPVAKKKQD